MSTQIRHTAIIWHSDAETADNFLRQLLSLPYDWLTKWLTITTWCYPGTYNISIFTLLKKKLPHFCPPLSVYFTLFPSLFPLFYFLCGDACSRWMTLWALSFHGCTLSVLWSSAPFSCLIWYWVCWAGKHLPLFTDRDHLLIFRLEVLCSCMCSCLLTGYFWPL